MSLDFLDKKFQELVAKGNFLQITQATQNLEPQSTFRLGTNSVRALTRVSSGEDILVFKNDSDGLLYAIAGRREDAQVINQRTILSRHTKPSKKRPSKPACEILKIAFVYRIINTNKSQQIWLSDFDGNTHLIKTIPAAIDYGDLTYTIEYTYPGYTWSRYDIQTEYQRDLSSNIYTVTKGELWDMVVAALPPDPSFPDSGTTSFSGSVYTGRYSCDHPVGSPPISPTLSTGSVSVNIADRFIPGYGLGEQGGSSPSGYTGPARPETSNFVGALKDEPDYPYEIAWGSLPDTGGSYTGFFDGEGKLIDSLVPYYFASADALYWGSLFTGIPISNPGGVGTTFTPEGIRRMTGVSTFRYRDFDDTITFSITPGQSRPSPIDAPAQVEAYLSFSSGKLQVLIRDTGRPSGVGPDQTCPPGDEDEDYFVNISKHELVGGAIQASTTLPNWMEVYDSPETRGNVLDGIANNNIQGQTFSYINNFFNQSVDDIFFFGRDWFVSPSDYIPVPNTDIVSVYGWEVETVDISSIKNIVLGTIDNEGFSYFVYPIQVDLDQYPTPMYIGRGGGSEAGEALPISAETNVNQIKATLSVPTIAGITADNFDVMAVVPSWGDNTFEHCLDLTQIVPISLGGS